MPAPASRILPRRKEFVVEDLRKEIREMQIRIDLLTDERNQLEELVGDLEAEVSTLRYQDSNRGCCE